MTPVGSEVLLYHDFNDEPLHTYTAKDVLNTWNARSAGALQPGAVKIVPDPDPSGSHGNVMQIFQAANSWGTHNDSGSSWMVPIEPANELYFAYDVYFEADAEFVKGSKLPGLTSPNYKPKASPADGTDRWNGRMMWKEGGKVISYVYHANQPGKYGHNIKWYDGSGKQVSFKRGEWNRVEVYYKINTPGVLDGRLKGWLNGELVLDTSRVMYRMPGGEHLKIGNLYFGTYYGGGDESWAPSTDQHVYFDNIVISTQPITH